jgi:tetratricopeptide (TPR) repeat protein
MCVDNGLTELQANFLYWQSRALRAQGQTGDSIEHARQALQILGDNTNPHLRGLLHAYLGSVSDSLPVDELNQHLTEALHIAENNGLPDVKVKALLEMARLAIYRTDRPSETLNYARQAAKIAAANAYYNEQVAACRQEAFANLRMGKFEEALALDQQAVDIARQHDLPIPLHLALFSLSVSWSSGMNNPARGMEALQESLTVARQYHFRPSRNVYGALFNITFALGMWEECRKAQNAFYEAVSNSYPRGLGYHLRMQGHELFALGQYENAAEAYRSAIAMYRKYSPDGRDVRTVEPYLGQALIEAGEPLAARPLLEDACDFWKGRQSSRYARGLCALAALSLKRGDCAQAIPLLRQALTAVEHAAADQPWPVRPQVSQMLGRALLMNGDREEALIHARWAYDCYKQMGHFLTGDAAYTLGQVYDALKKPELTGPCFVEARQKWTGLGLEHRLALFEK